MYIEPITPSITISRDSNLSRKNGRAVGIDILDKYVEQVKVVLNRIDVSYDTTKSPCLTTLVEEGKKIMKNGTEKSTQ
jgi:hypothetical protein